MLRSYNSNGGVTSNDIHGTLEKLCGDAEFSRPLYEIAKNWNKSPNETVDPFKEVFYYHLRYPNRFKESVFSGHAHHAVDLLFMFQTYNHLLSQEHAAAALKMGTHFIKFINGLNPWTTFTEESRYPAMCYGPVEVSLVEKSTDTLSRYEVWDQLENVQDDWIKASLDLRKEVLYS